MHGHLSLPIPFLSPFIPFFLHLRHLPLVSSLSAHHSAQQKNSRVKLRLAKQADGRMASRPKKESRWRERWQMSSLSPCEWSYCRKNWSEWVGFGLGPFRRFRRPEQLDWAWKLESDFTRNLPKIQSTLEQSALNPSEFSHHFPASFRPLSETKPDPESAHSLFMWRNITVDKLWLHSP